MGLKNFTVHTTTVQKLLASLRQASLVLKISENINLEANIKSWRKEVDKYKGFDVVFLDFCGQITSETLEVLKVLKGDFLSENGVLAFTFSVNFRNNPITKEGIKIRKGFTLPTASFEPGTATKKQKRNAYWSCDKTLKALGLTSRSLGFYMHYKEIKGRVPMVFFTASTNKTKGVAKKAVKTRNLNKLRRDYANATSSGVKAAIKRKMNQIQAG